MTAVALTWFYRSSTYRLVDEQLENTITVLIGSVQTVPETGAITLTRVPADPRYQQVLSGRYWVLGTLDETGAIIPISASRSLAEESLTLTAKERTELLAAPGEYIKTGADGPDDDDPLRVIARTAFFDGVEQPVVIAAAALSRPIDEAVQRFAALALGLMLLLTGGLVFAIVSQVQVGLKPLFDLRDRVADVREGRSAQVDGEYPSEIQPLATELNSLIEHNRDVVDQAKTHVSNLAHALKTPLAVLINEADANKSPLSDIVGRQSDVMKRQVDHHLRRARAAARGQAIGVSAPVGNTLEPLARTLERIYRDKDISFEMDIAGGLVFRGEKQDLEEMAGNLMDNACKWCASKVQVTARLGGDDPASIEITVSDDGPGLPPDQYEEALKRGARLDEATPGTGFGLAIVDDLARAYKGTVTLSRAEIGGLAVTLKLPGRV